MKRCLIVSVLLAAAFAGTQTGLRERVENSPALPYQAVTLKAQPPHPGWKLGMVSWIAVDRAGLIYMLQRGDKLTRS